MQESTPSSEYDPGLHTAFWEGSERLGQVYPLGHLVQLVAPARLCSPAMI